MKKLMAVLVVVVSLFALIVFLQNSSNKEKLENNVYGKDDLQQATIDLLGNEHYQNIILPEALAEKVSSGDAFYAYFFSPLCTYCKNLTPTLMLFADEHDIEVVQMNVLEFQNQMQVYKVEQTPTVVYFKDGVEQTRAIGELSKEELAGFAEATILKDK